jgi:hypothetical protein
MIVDSDTIAPTATCQAYSTFLNAAGNAFVTLADVNGNATDNCVLDTVFITADTFGCAEVGTIAIPVIAVDASGNRDTCMPMVTVLDTIAPVITCPAPVTVFNDSGMCSAQASLMASATDNCGGAATSASSPVTAYNVAASPPGAADTTSLLIPVSGLPVSAGGSLVVSARGDLDELIPFDDERFDILGEDGTLLGTTMNTPLNCDPSYKATPVSLTAGQINAWGADGTITIRLAPRQVGAIRTFWTGGSDAFATLDYTTSLAATNNRTAGGLDASSVYNVGTTTVEFIVTDNSGNSHSCTVMVTVLDTVAPTINTCPGPITVCEGDTVTYPTPTFDDNCGGTNVDGSLQSGQLSGTVFPVGINYAVWTYTDSSGNVSPACSVEVVVNPSSKFTVLPIGICPGDLVNLAGAIRDFSLLARVAVFYDAHPDSGGNVIGQAPMFRGTVRRTARILVSPPVSTTYYVSGITAQGCVETLPIDAVVGSLSRCSSTVAPIALLEGARDAATGTQRTALQQQALLPSIEPYTALGYTFRGGGGGEVMNMTPQQQQQVVDWVIIELHDSNDSTHATYSRAALLLADGRIVDTDGVSPPSVVANPARNYYLVIIHRNHLGLMTAQPVSLGSTVDFSNPNTAIFGISSSRVIINGKAYMYAGDANGDGQIQNTDDVLEWMPNAGTSGYQGADYNLDGQVQNTDRVFMWLRNVGRGTAVPD